MDAQSYSISAQKYRQANASVRTNLGFLTLTLQKSYREASTVPVPAIHHQKFTSSSFVLLCFKWYRATDIAQCRAQNLFESFLKSHVSK
jgi:hypothetical protein